MRNPLRLTLEALKRFAEQRSIVVPLHRTALGETPAVTFATLRDHYLSDSSVKAAIDNTVSQIVGPGFYIEAVDARAKSVVDDFNEDAGVDEWFQQACCEILYAGNHFLEYPDNWREPPDLTSLVIELSSIERIKRDEHGRVQAIIQKIGGQYGELNPKDILHFAWNPVDRRAFGTSIISPLANTRIDPDGETVPALLDIKAQLEQDMRRVIHKYPPRHLIQFKVGDQQFNDRIKPLLESAKPGQDLATNVEVDFKELTASSRASFAHMIDHLVNMVYLPLGPLPRLTTTTGFTEASARAALEVWESFRLLIQRFLKRRYERHLISRLLRAHGFSPARGQVRLYWGSPDVPEFTLDALNRLFELGGIRFEEYRSILRKWGLPIEEAETREERVETERVGGYAAEGQMRMKPENGDALDEQLKIERIRAYQKVQEAFSR